MCNIYATLSGVLKSLYLTGMAPTSGVAGLESARSSMSVTAVVVISLEAKASRMPLSGKYVPHAAAFYFRSKLAGGMSRACWSSPLTPGSILLEMEN